MDPEKIQEKLDKMFDMALEFSPKIITALLIIVIGIWIINRLMKILSKYIDKTGISADVKPFIVSLLSVLLKVMLVFTAAGVVGIETTSFVAVLAAAGFALGMALQGSLGNFAAGVMILLFKPYRVGDLISVQGQMGHVIEIQIFNTIVRTFDNKRVIIPNGMAISDVIENLSAEKHLRVDLSVYMPYEEDFQKVEQVILDALYNTPKVLNDPPPFVGIEEFDSHSIKVAVRPYAHTEDYWDVYFDAYKNVKSAMGENGINVAYSEGIELGKIGYNKKKKK